MSRARCLERVTGVSLTTTVPLLGEHHNNV